MYQQRGGRYGAAHEGDVYGDAAVLADAGSGLRGDACVGTVGTWKTRMLHFYICIGLTLAGLCRGWAKIVLKDKEKHGAEGKSP